MSSITIWHNPKCGTSRNVLAMIRASGAEPEIILYLDTPPEPQTLARVATAVGGVRKLLRTKGTPALELGLDRASDAEILAAMATHPLLIERPVVITPKGILLARPSERVLEVLDRPLPPGFTREDGKPVG